jgi:hypothetical protein
MFDSWGDQRTQRRGLGGYGMGMMAPTFDFYTPSGSQSSSFRAGSSVVIKARTAPEARSVKAQWTVNGNASGWQSIGSAQNGYFEGTLTFSTPGSYSFVLATPEDYEQPEGAAQNWGYFEILPALTTTTAAPTYTAPVTPVYTAPVSTTTSTRTPTSTVVYTAPPPVINAPTTPVYTAPVSTTPVNTFYPTAQPTTTQTTQQQCPTGYTYYAPQNACISANPQGCAVDQLYNWTTQRCETHNAGTVVAPQNPVIVQNPFYPTNYVPPTTAPPPSNPVQQYVPPNNQPIYNPVTQTYQQPVTQQQPAGAPLSDFFNSSLNLGGYEVPVLALGGILLALWFIK